MNEENVNRYPSDHMHVTLEPPNEMLDKVGNVFREVTDPDPKMFYFGIIVKLIEGGADFDVVTNMKVPLQMAVLQAALEKLQAHVDGMN